MSRSSINEEEIFSAALAINGQDERAAFLDSACGADPAVRERVESLLAAEMRSREFMPAQTGAGAATFQVRTENLVPLTEQPGTRIGRYKLLQMIGEGGCGTVFMAEQEEPVRRRVALKIIKLGMDTRSVIARFEAERQALALMDHPNIARVLDAGATDTGRPYFVMELVRGVPITKYCDESRLDNRARLGLFIQVCHAIQHAHQKGVIHRDIKPSNILVTLHDGMAVPKVIDFGIAKATTGERLTAHTVFTAFEQFIGTPAYMSPEQAEMSGLDIDTRSDIYSLGVLLYELLTGRTPFDAGELAKAGLDEIRRRIREEEPVAPSTRLSTLANDDLTAVARSRSTDAPRLAPLLRGDLDWVVLKCLEKERSRRYDTATALAGDIQRHLLDEPVTARPRSAAYRFQKFVRRHRTGFISGSVAVLLLMAGLGMAAWQAIRAGRAEKSERAQAVQARLDRDRAVGAEALAKEKAAAAHEAMQRATKSELEAQQNLYAADVRIAFEHVRMDNLHAARHLIEKHIPAAGAPEFRGFEWRYLRAQTEGDPHTALTKAGFGGASWIALSPDGRLAALCGRDVKVVSTDTGQEVFRLSSLANPRPEGRQGGRDGPPPGGPRRPTSRAGPPGAGNVIFTPDGTTLIAASDSGVQFIDTSTWQKRDAALPGAVNQAALSANGQVLATDGDDGVRVWTVTGDTWSQQHLIPNATRPVVLSPDGRRLLAGVRSDGSMPFAGLELWNLEGEPAAVMLADSAALLTHPSRLLLSTRSVAFSPDGKLIATASWTGDLPVTLWDGGSGAKLFELTGHTGTITSVDFSPDSRLLATGSLDSTVRLWDLTSRRFIRKQRGHHEQVNALRFSGDGTFLVSSSLDGAVLRWAVKPAAAAATRDEEEVLCWLSADGEEIATASRTAGLHIWKTGSGETIKRLSTAATSRNATVRVSPDGRLAAFGQADGSIALVSIATAEQTRLAGHAGGVETFEFSPDGRLLVSTGRDRRLRWWDLVARVQVAETEIEGRGATVSDFAFSPDGLTLAGAGFARLQKWSTLTHEPLPCDIPAWMRVNYSPDGRWLVVGSFGEEAGLRDAVTGDLRAAFAGHAEGVLGCAVSPDGFTVVSTSSDGTLRLWSVATERELALFWQKGRGFDRPMFSKDGRVLAAGSGHGAAGQVQIWRAPSWEEIDAVEKARPAVSREERRRPPDRR
jgi:WD40 repeat protein/serine/threonine protein kinase